MRRKHAFPATFFIINERLHSPPYGTMFCAAPILSPGPGPSFPPSLSPQPVNQGSWLSPDGRQAVSHQQWKQGLILCVSLLLFMPTCLLKFFHLVVPVASPSALLLHCPSTVSVFPSWMLPPWSASVPRRANTHGCRGAMSPGSLTS